MRTIAPRTFDPSKLSDGSIYWHQGWDIFPGVSTPGRSLVAEIAKWIELPERLDGKRVLDVGAWNGCMSLECERRGAVEVTALSLEHPEATGFTWLKDLVESERTSYVRGTIYDLDPARLGTFDIVLCFGVIYHLRYPILGMDNLRRVTTGELYLETHVIDTEAVRFGANGETVNLREIGLEKSAIMQFYPKDELMGDWSNWFGPSSSAVQKILDTAGFTVEHCFVSGNRGYFRAKVRPGLPPFIANGVATYEGNFYEVSLMPLFGPVEQWVTSPRRNRPSQKD
jgi:tRNA (mo5U34)-methyltransferase